MRDVTRPTIRVTRQPARLRIVKGGGGGPFELAPREYVIGRSRSSDIVVEDPSVSGRHARLAPGVEDFTIEDLSSSNGTTVNGRPVQGRVTLRGGETIAVGEAELRYEAPR